jgi:hypothetical protein
MRKVILGAILVFSTISCSKEDINASIEQISKDSTTISVTFNNKKGLTTKNVKRGLLPNSVSKINIATSKESTDYLYHIFNLVNNNEQGDSTFVLKNVKAGNIKFVAETEAPMTNNSRKYLSNIQGHGLIFNINEINRKLDSLSKEEPYMRFKSKLPITREVIAGENSDLEFEMVPVNGKSIAFFKLSDELIGLGCTFDVMQNPYSMWYGSESKTASNKCIALIANPQVVGFDDGGYYYKNNGGSRGENGIYPQMWYMIRVWDAEGQLVKDDKFGVSLVAGACLNNIFTITSANSILPSTTKTIFDFPIISNNPVSEINK